MIQYASDSVIARGKSGILDEIIIIVTSCLSNSVLIIIEAVLLFLFFLQITIDSRKILEVGKSVFGVYLLHDSIFTRTLTCKLILQLILTTSLDLQKGGAVNLAQRPIV